MKEVLAYAGVPLALAVTSFGWGLLVEAPARAHGRLPNELLVPAGFCACVAATLAVYRVDLGAAAAVAVLLGGAAAGLALARRELRERVDPGWAGLAGLAVYALYVAPALLSGGWTWGGYNFLNDTSVQFLLTEHLKEFGTQVGTIPISTEGEVVRTYLASGYPLGAHSELATLGALLGTPVEVVYQPFLAAMAAVGAMALASFARTSGFGAAVGALVAAVAMSANLAYQFALQGSIKEVAALVTLAVAATLAARFATAERPLGAAVPLGVAVGSVLGVYSAAGGPYVAALAGVLALALVLHHRRAVLTRHWLVPIGVACAGALAAAAPALSKIVTFYRVSDAVVDASQPVGSMLGQLARPLPLSQVSGVWLAGDYTLPIPPGLHDTLTALAAAGVAALLALGAAELALRRTALPLVVVVPPLLAGALVAPRVSPYADAKLLAIASPFVLLGAAYGLLLLKRLTPVLPALAGAALALGVGVSAAYAYHDVRLAPPERMEAIEDVGERFSGRGLVLFNEFEEFAKYFARDARINVPSEALTPRQVQLREPTDFFGYSFDLDEQVLGYVEQFPYLVTRRSPAASRPPANYRRVFSNRWYVGWRRMPSPTVLDHLPLQPLHDATARPPCRDVERLARAARPGEWLVAAQGPETATFHTAAAADRSAGWVLHVLPGIVEPKTPGHARGRVRTRAGTHDVWLRGSFGRPVRVLVDGREVGSAQGIDTPGSWTRVARIRLTAGVHRVELRRRGGGLAPGDGAPSLIGPLTLERTGSRSLTWVRPGQARKLCGRQLDWVERVRR